MVERLGSLRVGWYCCGARLQGVALGGKLPSDLLEKDTDKYVRKIYLVAHGGCYAMDMGRKWKSGDFQER